MRAPANDKKVVPIRPLRKTGHHSRWANVGRQSVKGVMILFKLAIYVAAIWWVTNYLLTGRW